MLIERLFVFFFLIFLGVFCSKEVLRVDGVLSQSLEMCDAGGKENKSTVEVDIKGVLHNGMTLKMGNLSAAFFGGKSKQDFAGNVFCGDGFCPVGNPICCGGAHFYYCIPGGKKCCFSPGGEATSCEQSEECCVVGDNATCCRRGTKCRHDGKKLSCDAEMCTRHETTESCLYSGEGCEWCCSERRCVDKGQLCSTQEKPIKLGEVCSSPCQYAETCTRCLLNDSLLSGADGCLWCCATQSCVPLNRANECGNAQTLQTLSLCPSCQANKDGVAPQTMGSVEQFIVIVSGVVLIMGFLSCFGVVRAFFYFRRGFLTRNGMRVGDVSAQLSVRRHGFVGEGFVPLQERVKGVFSSFFGAIQFLFGLRKKEKGLWEGLPNALYNNGLIFCAACYRLLRVSFATSITTSTKGIIASGETHSDAHGDENENSVEECIVVLLPCSHTFCRYCVGLSLKERKRASGACQGVSVAAPGDSDSNSARFTIPGDIVTGDYTAVTQKREEEGETTFTRKTQSWGEGRVAGATLCAGRGEESEENGFAQREPQHYIKMWKETLLSFLRMPGRGEKDLCLAEERPPEAVVLQKIGHKCPNCKHVVSDVFFPENILQL